MTNQDSTSLSIPDLRKDFKNVIAPGDAEYDSARAMFYGGIDLHPAVIIQPTTAAEVAQAITLAAKTGLPLAIRSGGHSFAGYSSCEGGIVLDLRQMRAMELNEAEQTAWVEPGLTAGEFSKELSQHNLVIGFGDTGSVGIGGITLGGGVGYLVRKYGLAIDNLLAAEIVTADGQILKVDEQNHPDLFWAIRGGGGNFGVVTKFQFKLHKLDQALGGMLLLPAEPEVVVEFMKMAKEAPEELSSIMNVMPAPPMPFLPKELHGKLSIMALMMYAGDPTEGEKVVAPFRVLAKPLADMIKPMKYADIFPPEDGSYHPTAVAKTMFMKHLDIDLAKNMINELLVSTAAMRAVQLRVLGGAMARIPAEATAFAHRQQSIMVNVAAFYTDAADKALRLKWVENMANLLNQGDNSAYVGFLSPDEADRTHDAYPEATWKRLVTIKQKYDPNNLFKLNCNISPK